MQIGVKDTFCRGRYMDRTHFYFNQHPMAHANHFEFSSDFLEIASTSGYKKTKYSQNCIFE